MKTTTQSPFEKQLLANMRACIRESVQDGTCGMGFDCFKQCVKSPSPGLAGAPLGTNARYYYGEMFWRLVQENRDVKAFVLADGRDIATA